ncbi:MAG: type II toxin-antitoxin system death-on-curing family toxin [Candidatus Omnitrophica bacterium]|nr:type II toxin-antitoxin system death-on-curing family toxin [Candidatus Omnitrophota bacterium]
MPQKSKSKKNVSAKALSAIREEGVSYGYGEPVFLTLDQVLKSHTRQLEQFGGTDGVRDMALLESAMAQPESAFSGHWLHADLFEMAAAYAFHICKNHPFFDGNKRAALDAALIFFELNGVSILANKGLIDVMLSVAEGKMSKKELAEVFRDLPKE